MIIRERQDDIVMITQDDHARVSGVFAARWKDSFFGNRSQRGSVELAINEHDRGWIPVDNNPFLNDRTMLPYSFMDLPTDPKLVFYKNGIDEAEQMDDYAGVLCSHHYAQFAANDSDQKSKKFVQHEEDRQNQLKGQVEDFDEKLFQFHYDLLKFCDNLSLYVCLNEPGVTKEDEHRFHKNGLPVPATFSFFNDERLAIHWRNDRTVLLSEFPFDKPVPIDIKQKVVPKQDIADRGLLIAYESAPIEEVHVVLKVE